MHIFMQVVILFLGTVLGIGEAVMCFECTSGFDTGCGIPFKAEGLRTCKGLICSLVDRRVKGIRSISRGCHNFSPEKTADTCTKTISTTTCYCFKDYCNKHGVTDWASGSSISRADHQTHIVVSLACFITFSFNWKAVNINLL